MSERLARMERSWAPKEAELESRRWANIASAEKELNAYLDKTREAREKTAQEREQRIASAKDALAKYESELPMHLEVWEKSDQLATDWQVLDFDSMKSTFGAKLEKLSDGSIFASEKNKRGNYDLAGDFYGKTITGIRIEALTDERLPKNGPGRADDGNFVLSEFKVQWADPSKNKEVEVQKWSFEKTEDSWQGNDQVSLDLKDGALEVVSKGKDPSLTADLETTGELFLLEVLAKLDGTADSQLFWKSDPSDNFQESDSVKLTFSGQDKWLPYRYYFRTKGDLAGLRYDPDSKAGSISIRQIKLVRIEDPEFKDVKLVDAKADFSQKNYDVATAVDGRNGDNNNGWAISPEGGKPHQAIFSFKEPIESDFGAKLKLTMMQNYRGNTYSLGRFRVSVTTSPAPLDFGLPKDVRSILAIASDNRTEEQQKRMLDYFSEFGRQIIKLRDSLAEAKQPLPEDPEMKKLEEIVATAKKPIKVDAALVRLRAAVDVSSEQLKNKRLTAAQDVAWALINNPAFLFNH